MNSPEDIPWPEDEVSRGGWWQVPDKDKTGNIQQQSSGGQRAGLGWVWWLGQDGVLKFDNDDIKIWLCVNTDVSKYNIGNIRILTRDSAFWRTLSCFENKILKLMFVVLDNLFKISSSQWRQRLDLREKERIVMRLSVQKRWLVKKWILPFFQIVYIFKAKVSCCFLCKEPLVAFDSGCPLKSKLLQSQHTFLEVLSKLFQKENLASHLTNAEFSNSSLCFKCKPLVEDLFRLQHQVC